MSQPPYPHEQHMMTQVPGIEYVVVAKYEPQDVDRCIECQANDHIFVQLPFVFEFHGTEQHPDGWLYGTNLSTNLTGYVPAAFVKYIQTTPLSPIPPQRPGLPKITEEGKEPENPVEASDGLDQPPVVPPRIPRPTGAGSTSPMTPSAGIQDYDWYWGNVSRDEVNEILRDTPDGTFLVRDATNAPGDYTLTLRKEGMNKLIRIYQRNGLYGFSAPFTFLSVKALVDHHRTESLERYNEDLTVCLKHPAQRPTVTPLQDIEALGQALQRVHLRVFENSNEYEKIYNECNKRQQSIQHKKTAIDAYTKTIEIFEKQCSILELCLNKGNHDENRLMDNFKRLQSRLQDVVEQRQELEMELQREIQENRQQDFIINSLKGEIHNGKKQRDAYIMQLRAAGVSDYQINSYLHINGEMEDEEDIYSVMPSDTEEDYLKRRFPLHHNKNNWYFPDFEREDATRILTGQRTGTFLIRPSKRAAFACSLVANGRVHHCLIQRTAEGYGFAEPFNLHQSVEDLVLHYAQNSLIPHNEKLDTELLYPARLVM